MGVANQRFVDMHKDKVVEMKRLLVSYVRNLHNIAKTTANIQTPVVSNEHAKIQMSPDGFPIIPTAANFAQWKKPHLTDAIRTYMNTHYSKTKATHKRNWYTYTIR